MSLDFDSAALQMQHEDEEYDQEDYAREQEKRKMYYKDVSVEIHSMYQNLTEGLEEQVHSIQDSLLQLQQLLTDLPHDMLEDSGDHLSDYSVAEDHEQAREHWDQDASRWKDHPVATNPQSDYEQGQNFYAEHFQYDQGNIGSDMHASDWPDHRNEDEDKSMFEISGRASEDGSEDDVYLGGDGYKADKLCQQTNGYHLSENFRPYANSHQQEFSNQHATIPNFVDTKKEHLKFGTSEVTNNQAVESYKVIYKPCQNNIQKPVSSDAARRNEVFEEMQQEFLGTGEGSSDNMQILQLQVLNKAKGRQLEELNKQLEERAQQIRYLSHQLAIVKDEKDGMCLSLQEGQTLYQKSKEREVQLEGQIKALETQIQTLTTNEEQLIKQSKVAEVAMESLQQQLLELRRSDALQRAREQHEAIVAALKQKYEEQTLLLQQKLDAKHVAHQEQIELCCHMREHMKQLERNLEESKLEKNNIINQLSRSLEESQNQCANLLQSGLVKETNQLRMQLHQAQSAQLISSEMNKALQEELKELKEELVLYESAAKHGVFLNDPGGELNVDMSDSYVDLGIKKVNPETGLHSTALSKEVDRGLSKDEIISDLKAELERSLSSNKAKRKRISELQNDLKDCQRTVEELKEQLVKTTNVHEPKGRSIEDPSNILQSNTSEEILRLKMENQDLHQEAESHNVHIQELTENQEKLKNKNQELCSQMRELIRDFDQDKQEALDRCERTYRQHFEDVKKKLCEELAERHAAEKEKLRNAYEETITQLKADIEELNKEIITVKECYVTVCREREKQEGTLKAAFEQEQQMKEEKLKKQLLEEKEEAINRLRTELEETHKSSMALAKSQWQKEKESDMKMQIENQVAEIKAFWEKEQKESKDQAIQAIEKEWQYKLDQALEEGKRAVVELTDHWSQTEPLSAKDELLCQAIAEAVEEQTLLFREALKEKEKMLRAHEARYHEGIASQVESALTKARTRWLEELTELEEYKAHLKLAKEEWEKEFEIGTAKQVSLALSAAEEKWKKELENSEKAQVRTKELEERIHSLKRELEVKQNEIPAIIKAELAKARAQWNKEKQEEIFKIQDRNEKDYHSFLHDHKNKINEVLAKAREDFAKQKKELLDEKEAELRLLLNRKQQEWAVQETKRFQNEIHQYEERLLVQVELLLDDIHKDFVRCASSMHTWQAKWNASVQSNLQFKEKLAFCLQKAYRDTVCVILEKAKQERNEKHEDLDYNFKDSQNSYMQSGEGETGDKARPSMFDIGQQVELQRRLRKSPFQETEMDIDSKCRKRNPLSQEVCCEHCHQQLEKKEKECQDLKKKLDKACKHLQLAVKEQKAKLELIQENENNVDKRFIESPAMKDTLDDLKASTVPPRSLSEGCVLKPCTSCDGKALEEMRSQYIKAVGKIKSDMLRYIHESKERAAEIIKAEVLRERQETARKMRKYYLICLQQLLIDDGKHEGAEKKIICAASKIATMAKVLETPVRSSFQNKATHAALSHNSKLLSEAEELERNYSQQPKSTIEGNQTHGGSMSKITSNPAMHKRIPCSLQQQLDAESQAALPSRSLIDGRKCKNASRGLPHAISAATLQNPLAFDSQAKFQDVHTGSCADGASNSGVPCVKLKNVNDRTAVKEPECAQSVRHQNVQSEKTPVFRVQETPVRDEGCSPDWSRVSGAAHLDSSDRLLYSVPKVYSSVPEESHEQAPMTTLFSRAKKDASAFCQQPSGHKDNTLATKCQDLNCKESHLSVSPGHLPYPHMDKLSPCDVHLSGAALCSTAGKSCNPLHSRRQIRDVTAFQQDSGFDSPQINFD